MTNVLSLVIAVSALLLCRVFVAAQIKQLNQSTQANQASCLGPDEAKVLLAQLDSPRNFDLQGL